MIHGTQKIELTVESVSEALQDYLSKHLAPDVVIRVTSWEGLANGYSPTTPVTSIEVSFEQREDKPGPSAPDQEQK